MIDATEQHAAELIPSNYASWRYCIEVKCGLALTTDYLRERIVVLSNSDHEETKRFAKLYGNAHREQVLAWFREAAAEA